MIPQLKIRRQILAGILDIVDDAIIVVKTSGKVVFCNRPCEKFTGHGRESILDHSVLNIFQNNLKIEQTLEKLFKKNLINGVTNPCAKVIFQHQNSSCFPGRILFIPLDIENERLVVMILKRKETSRVSEVNLIKQNLIKQNLERQKLGVKTMSLAIEYWCSVTQTTKVALAEHSKLWKVYRSPNGFERTQTLDKYLSPRHFPKKPRWGHVFQTLSFVLSFCKTPSSLRLELENSFTELKMIK